MDEAPLGRGSQPAKLTWGDHFPGGTAQSPPGTYIGENGAGAAPLILHNGSFRGRRVVPYRLEPYQVGNELFPSLPRVTFADSNSNWSAPEVMTRARVLGAATTHQIFPLRKDYGGGAQTNFPGSAVHPNWADHVCIVFSACAEPEPPAPQPESRNTDLCVAYSTTAGSNFSGTNPGENVVRLRDSDIGEEEGTHQIMPWVTIDHHGGINILYYSAKVINGVWNFQARYARIPGGFPISTNPGPIVTRELSSYFTLQKASPTDPNVWFGDYVMIDSRGCDVYAGFMQRAGLGPMSVYVAKIKACTESDSDKDGAVTASDPTVFVSQFAAGDPTADLNRDGALNTLDVNRFVLSHACACNPE